MTREEFWCAMAVMALGAAVCLAMIAYYGGWLAFTWGVFLEAVSMAVGIGWHHGFDDEERR